MDSIETHGRLIKYNNFSLFYFSLFVIILSLSISIFPSFLVLYCDQLVLGIGIASAFFSSFTSFLNIPLPFSSFLVLSLFIYYSSPFVFSPSPLSSLLFLIILFSSSIYFLTCKSLISKWRGTAQGSQLYVPLYWKRILINIDNL